jgi:hypothetical protein
MGHNAGSAGITKREVLLLDEQGEGPLGKSDEDEPIFVVTARDVCAEPTIRAWLHAAARSGVPGQKRAKAAAVLSEMVAWKVTKVPD